MIRQQNIERAAARLAETHASIPLDDRRYALWLADKKLRRVGYIFTASDAFREDLLYLFADGHLSAPDRRQTAYEIVPAATDALMARSDEYSIAAPYNRSGRDCIATMRSLIYFALMSSNQLSLASVRTPEPIVWPWEAECRAAA